MMNKPVYYLLHEDYWDTVFTAADRIKIRAGVGEDVCVFVDFKVPCFKYEMRDAL